jgi:hypothetical protein
MKPMKTPSFFRHAALSALTVLLLLAANSGALACEACYSSNTGSKMGNAASVGIAAMVVIMFVMLGAVAAFGRHLAYRAKHPLPDYQELLKEDETPPDSGASS